MPTTTPLYRALAALAVPLTPLVRRDPRQRAAHRGRLAAPAELERWAREHRDPARRLAWFHASSVGEGLQARAVLDVWRTLHPDHQVIYTHFSPSAVPLAASIAADWAGYLPYDRPGDVHRALTAVKPDLLVFAKLDLWPELATAAHTTGCRVAMVAATVAPDSGRLRPLARRLTTSGYTVLDIVGAVSDDDAARLVTLGCAADRLVVTGDPRIDSVMAVVRDAALEPPPVQLGDPSRVLVAGSTWPADEEVVLQAFGLVRQRHADARLILVPHEPTLTHLLRIEAAEMPGAMRPPMLLGSMVEGDEPEVLVIDRVGMLARLYAAGALAYVGGGFGHAGIHSVLEPAAWGRPVVIGPHDRGSRDAALLRASGGLCQLPREGAVEALVTQWSAWLDDPASAVAAGTAARGALRGDVGAAERSARVLGG